MQTPTTAQLRYFLKDSIRKTIDFSATDQHRGVPPPPVQKPYDAETERIELPPVETMRFEGQTQVADAISGRRSRRNYRPTPLTLEELSFLLWATQGIRARIDAGTAFRTVPSAGSRHAFETYLLLNNITGVDTAIYRYLPIEHQLLFEFYEEDISEKLVRAAFNQRFVGKAAAVFIWTAIPYRMEWRYADAAYKVILLDAGHVCQNLYLACEAITAGTCAIAAYDQELMDQLLRLDGDDEFTIYLAPVGKY